MKSLQRFFIIVFLSVAMCLQVRRCAAQHDTSGVYFPVVVSSNNVGNVTPQVTHFIKVRDQVFVSGRVFINGGVTVGQYSTVTLTLPFVSNGVVPLGQQTIHENGVQIPAPGSFGTSPGFVQLRWKAQTTLGGNNDFYFMYTIQP